LRRRPGIAALRFHERIEQRIEKLLAAHQAAAGLLDRPLLEGDKTSELPSAEGAGLVIAGRYKLLEEIAEGGMGTVWVAEQTQPVRRRVAIKLVKPGMDIRRGWQCCSKL
jgi:eukaryotic-like serine/threonine-protein kinase